MSLDRFPTGLGIAEGDLVAIHGRTHGWGMQVVVDRVRIENGRLAEHGDVLQDEVPSTSTAGDMPTLDPREGARRT